MPRITTCLLCDYAQVRDSLLYVVAGCATRIPVPELPSRLSGMLALVLEVLPDEFGTVHEISVAVNHAETPDEVMMRATAAIHVQPAEALQRGESACMPMAMPLGGRVDRYGALDVKSPSTANRRLG